MGFSGRKCFCIPMANTRNEDGQGGRNKRVSTVELSLVHTKSWQNPKEMQVDKRRGTCRQAAIGLGVRQER